MQYAFEIKTLVMVEAESEDDVRLLDYAHFPTIKAPVAV